MTYECMKNMKELIKHDGIKISPWNDASIEQILIAIVVSSKGSNKNESMIADMNYILNHSDFIKDCNRFDNFLKECE